MSDTPVDLGGRLPLLDPESLTGDQKMLYERISRSMVAWADRNDFQATTKSGELIGPFNPWLYSTGITPGFISWFEADAHHSSLDKRVHEVVILSVGAVWRSPYELYAHSAVARGVGLSESLIHGLVEGRSPDELSTKESIAHRFARQLAAERRIDEPLFREAEAAFGRVGVVDMVYLIGMYLLICAFLNAFEIPAAAGLPT